MSALAFHRPALHSTRSRPDRRREAGTKLMARCACLVIALFGSACAGSMIGVLQAKQDGKTDARVYDLSPDQAWLAAETVLRWEGAGPLEEHPDRMYILTSGQNPYGQQAGQASSYVGAWIEPGLDGVLVSCAISGPAYFDEGDFHRRFMQAARYLEAGQPLPLSPPR